MIVLYVLFSLFFFPKIAPKGMTLLSGQFFGVIDMSSPAAMAQRVWTQHWTSGDGKCVKLEIVTVATTE